ncbi:DUF6906 family protein [Alkalibaculum sporogenes]|uniref:DUF6906 family protein n=1 Tax=Alkalibaculum sporogenes TaxID=2655001 RepID=UPI00187B503A|nr:hypothetical protein [Alkalibaculum sporogenes]
MKHGKKLTLKEKELLKEKGYDPAKFLRIKRTTEKLEFLNIDTKQILPVRC